MKRWFIRLFAALAGACLLLAGLAWLTLRASLPQLDGEIAVDGVAASVSITRDAAGIPTIKAANRLDLAFATGFVHGQDRFFQMDLIRRDAAGELSELIGAVTIAADRQKRLHRFRSRAVKSLASMSPFEREILRRYSDGVNAGLASLGAKPFEYYVLGAEPEPWIPEDCILVSSAMFVDLNDERAVRDRQRGLIARVLPRAVLDWLDPDGSPWDAPMFGAPRAAMPIPGPEVFSIRDFPAVAARFDESGPPPVRGSNNWAVSGDLTASGRALVSNDMHLGLAVPTIYYRVRLISTAAPAVDVSGVSLPGEPLIIAGSNGRVAWGFTNSYGDWSDAVLLRPGEQPGSYRTPDGERLVEEHAEPIAVKGGAAVPFVVRETIWGPIDDEANYPDGDIAISWTGHVTAVANLGLMQLETTDTVDDALQIATRTAMPPQNFVAGDADGNIGWTISGYIPMRGDFDPSVPADWSEQHGWLGWLPPEQYPRIVNPDSGRIWSANSRVVDGAALRVLGDSGYAFGARARQIRDALFAREQFAPQDMLAIQMDDRAVYLAQWQALLLDVLQAAPDAEPALAEYRRLVENWTPRAAPEAVGFRLVRSFRNEVRRRVFGAMLTPVRAAYGDDISIHMSRQFDAPLWSLVSEQPAHLLPADYASWNELMLDAVRETVRYFDANYSGTLAERRWGEYNTAEIRHPLSKAVPALSRWLDMPADELSGDADMPKAQGRDWGASERFSVAPGDEEHSLMHMPGGQSGHPLSPFYRRGHNAWVTGAATPFLPGPAQHQLILQPTSR